MVKSALLEPLSSPPCYTIESKLSEGHGNGMRSDWFFAGAQKLFGRNQQLASSCTGKSDLKEAGFQLAYATAFLSQAEPGSVKASLSPHLLLRVRSSSG